MSPADLLLGTGTGLPGAGPATMKLSPGVGVTLLIGVAGSIFLASQTHRLLRSKLSQRRRGSRKPDVAATECYMCNANIELERPDSFATCRGCERLVCRGENCCQWVDSIGIWECGGCQQNRVIQQKAGEWLLNQLTARLKQPGPVELKEGNLLGLGIDSDADTRSTVSVGSSSVSVNQRIKVREFIEELLSTMLHGSLDDVSVGQLMKNESYIRLFRKFHTRLSRCLYNLELSIHQSLMADLPLWEGQQQHHSPSDQHFELKQLVQKILEEIAKLPELLNHSGLPLRPEEHLPYFDPKKYEQLLATAVLNKVVDDYRNPKNFVNVTSSSNSSSGDVAGKVPGELDINHNKLTAGGAVAASQRSLLNEGSLRQMSVAANVTARDPSSREPDEDAEDDEYSAERRLSDTDESYLSDYIQRHKVPLPDLSDTTGSGSGAEDDDLQSLKSNTTDGTWEENWLFRKRQLKTTESSIAMLVPSPTEEVKALIGDKNADEISDLSEAGSDCEAGYESDGKGQDSSPAGPSKESTSEAISSSSKANGDDSLDEQLPPDSLVSVNSLPGNEQLLSEAKNSQLVGEQSASAAPASGGAGGESFSLMDDLISIGPVMVASEKVETKNTALTNPFLDDPFEPNNNDITDDVKLLQRTNEQASNDLRSSHLEPTVNGSSNRKEIPIDRANPQQTSHPQHSNSLTPSNPVADSSVVNVAVANEPSSVEDSASKQPSSGDGSIGREDSNSPECFPGMPQAAQLLLLNSLTPPSSPYPEVLSPHPITMTITDVFERMTNSPPLAMISEEAAPPAPAGPVASLVDANPFQSIDEQESIQTVYTAQENPVLSPSDSFQAEQDDSEYRTVSEATNNSLLTVESFDAEPNAVLQEHTEQHAPAQAQEALYVKDQEEVEFRATRQEEEEEAPVVHPFERDVDNSSRIQLHTADLVTFNNGPSPEGYPGVAAVTEQIEAYCEELKGHRPDAQSKEDEQHKQPQEIEDPGWVLVDSSEDVEAVSKLEDQPQQTVDDPRQAEPHREASEDTEALNRVPAPQQATSDPWKVVDELQQPANETFMLETEETQQTVNDPWQTVPHTGVPKDAEAHSNLEEPPQAADDPWMVIKDPQQAVNAPWNPETKKTQQIDDDPWQTGLQPCHDDNSNRGDALLDPFLTPFEAVNLRMAEYTDSMKGIEHVEEAIEMEEETCVLPQTSVETDDASSRALCVSSPELERHGVQIEQTPSTEDPPTEQLLLEPLEEEETDDPVPSIGADEQLLASIESESKLEDTSLPFSDTDLHSLSSPPTSVTTFAINHPNCMPTNPITDQTPPQSTICTTTTTNTTTTSIDNTTSTNHSNNDQQPDPEPEPEQEPEPNTSSDADCSLIPAQIESAAEPTRVIMSNGGASTNGHHTDATDEKQPQLQMKEKEQEPLDREETLIPGSIAEREHLKWRNAKPIANNPYSPDALQRRLSEKSRPSSMIEIDRLVRKEAAPNGDDGMLRIGDDDPSSEPGTDAASDQERSAKVCASSEQKKIGREYYINDPERIRAGGGGGCVKQTLGNARTHAHHQQSHSTDDEKSLLLGRNPEDSGAADDGATIFAARPVHVTPADELRRGSKGNALSEAAREVFLLSPEPDTSVTPLIISTSELSLIASPTASHARQEFDSLTYSEDSDVTRIYDPTTGEAKVIRTAATPQPAEEGDKILEILPQHPPASSRQTSQTPDAVRDGNFLRSSHFVVKPLSPETIKFFAPKRKLSFTGSHSNLAVSDAGAASRSTTPGMRDSTMHSSMHTDCPVRSGATEYSIIEKDVIDVLPSVKELAKCYSGSTNDVSLMPPKPLYKPRVKLRKDFLRQSSDVLNEETVVIDEKTGMPCSREKGQRQYCSTSSIAVRDEIREIRKINLEAYRQAAAYYPMAPGHSITARSLSKQIREHKSNVTDDHKVVQHHDQADELLAGGGSSDGAGGHISPERPSSPVLLPGHLKSSIEFFESLKNRT